MIDRNTKPGTKLYQRGRNKQCRHVVCTTTLHRWFTEKELAADQYGRDCVTESGGLKMVDTSADLYTTRKECMEAIGMKVATKIYNRPNAHMTKFEIDCLELYLRSGK